MGEVMRSPNFKKMTVNLMTTLFERKVLAESSVTGKSKKGRPALGRTKVELIIGKCVFSRYFKYWYSMLGIFATLIQSCVNI